MRRFYGTASGLKLSGEAFEKLNYREQTLLEKRNAICMTCGRVSPISTRLTFEELAVLFEGSTASGAERAYRKAVDHLACLLTEAGVLHMIRLKRKSQTKRKRKSPPLSTSTRWTTTANGVRFRLILRLEQRRLSAWQSGIRW